MQIKFTKTISLLVRLECYGILYNDEQEWEFDEGEIFDVKEVRFSDERNVKSGKKAKSMRFVNILLNQGDEDYPDYIFFVPENCFEIL
jgi:hypothetical protein